MGCWNETCAISFLPIRAGEKIKMLCLENMVYDDETGKTVCYSTDLYSPLCFPISGTYNDYGGIEDVDLNGMEVKIFLEVIHSRLIPMSKGKNQYHERAIPAKATWQKLMNGFQDGRVRLDGRFSGVRGSSARALVKVFVKESVWDAIAAQVIGNDRPISSKTNQENLLKFFEDQIILQEKLKAAQLRVKLTGQGEDLLSLLA